MGIGQYAADIKVLEAFHMKCHFQCQITKIRWQDHIRNAEVAYLTWSRPRDGENHPLLELTFRHVARLAEDTPAHQALRCHIDLSRGCSPD